MAKNENEEDVELQLIIGDMDSEMILKLKQIIDRDSHKIPNKK